MRAMSSGVYTRGKQGCVLSCFTTRPTSRFLRIRRSSWVSEYLVHCLRYALTSPFSFFESPKYPNFPSVRPIHSYASSRSVLLKVALFESFKNSLSCAILTTLSSFMAMFIPPHCTATPRGGGPLGSLYAGIVFDFSTILRWTRLRLSPPFTTGYTCDAMANPTTDTRADIYPGIDLLNLQLAAGLRGDFTEGWRLAKILQEERPGDARCAFNRGWYEMMHGDLQKGMELMDLGRTIEVFGSEMLPEGAPPMWPGSRAKLTAGQGQPRDLEGKTVLLRGEGGFGDEMIHVRFARDLAARGARVVVSCHKGLMSLFSRVEGVSSVIPHHLIQNTHFDYWVPAMSAARWLGHTFETLPGGPYLTADPVYVEKWKTILAMKQVRLTSKPPLRVWIRWSGNPKFEH